MTTGKRFAKNDGSFNCAVCGVFVPELKVTSRNHCNSCLASVHVDISPGDRANPCGGVLLPVGLTATSKKGYIIEYRCDKCGEASQNKSAHDDNFERLLEICKTKM